MNRISTTTARIHTRNTRLQALSATILVALIALTGAAWMNITVPAADSEVVQLERVVISGVSTPDTVASIEKLPRVVIEGRRNAGTDSTQVASACVAPAVC